MMRFVDFLTKVTMGHKARLTRGFGLWPSRPGDGALRAWEREMSERMRRPEIDMTHVPTRQRRRAEERRQLKAAISSVKARRMKSKTMGGAATVRFRRAEA